MIELNEGNGTFRGTKSELMADIALIMRIMLEKGVMEEDDLLYALTLAESVDCTAGINVKDKRNGTKDS